MEAGFAIHCESAGKKFGRDWIFRKVNEEFRPREKVAILGQNGSGKSTFLMSLSGFYALSEGNIHYQTGAGPEDGLAWYRQYTLISPLLELPEELSVEEFLDTHFRLKTLKEGWDKQRMFEETGLLAARGKLVKQLSSGMRQRLKLLMAFLPRVPVIFLDEPCTNLDEAGIALYRRLVDASSDQLLLIASNMKVEYDFCERSLVMEELR